MVSAVIRSTLICVEVPDEMRGRLSALNTIFVGASNELGQSELRLISSFVESVLAVVLGRMDAIRVAAIS